MQIEIMPLLEGAAKAEGIAVVIDVFRAFSLECYLFSQGVTSIYPVDSLEKARELKKKDSELILFGERQGLIQEGFDYGNSPYHIKDINLDGKTAVHASSSGTRGLFAAVYSNADTVITGSYVNAKAIARYIKSRNPQKVTLIPMGWAGEYMTLEDQFCAEYIISLLQGRPDPHPNYLIDLYETDGKRFFDKKNQASMPIADFYLCLQKDVFDFVLIADKTSEPVRLIKKNI